jgi:hypothetical protein
VGRLALARGRPASAALIQAHQPLASRVATATRCVYGTCVIGTEARSLLAHARMRSWMLPIVLVACAEPGPDTDEVEVIDGKADTELRVRVDGLTVWIDPAVTRADGDRPWRLDGRASKNLASVHSFVPDDGFGRATVKSARTFELALDDHELNTILSGMPLFVEIEPTSGASATASVWLAPKLGEFSGTSKLRIDSTVTPRWVAGDVIYRGGARVEPGWSMAVAGDDAPQVFAEPVANRFRIDIHYRQLAPAATAPFTFEAHNHDGSQSGAKQARVVMATRRIGLTRLDPEAVWQQRCEAKVRTCLQALPASTADAGTCGTYRQVHVCGGLELGEQPAGDRIASDLRAFLVGYYADHGADITGSGGNTLAQAQAAVDPTKFTLVTDPGEDPFAHDLGAFWVFRHPDITFPGSDIAWFAAYEKSTGALVEIYDFN